MPIADEPLLDVSLKQKPEGSVGDPSESKLRMKIGPTQIFSPFKEACEEIFYTWIWLVVSFTDSEREAVTKNPVTLKF